MSELELKFRVSPAASERLRRALIERGAVPVRMRARYYDTADGRLASAGVSWRLRQEGDRWVQTLKSAGSSQLHRLEHEVVVQPRGRRAPLLDPRLHQPAPAGALLLQALAGTVPADWIQVQATDIERLHGILVSDGGTEVDAALDIGRVTASGRQAAIAEFELEYVSGPGAGLFEIAAEWLGEGMWLSTLSKSGRARRLGQVGPVLAVKAHPPLIDGESNAAAIMRAALRAALDQVLDNATELADGAFDDEHVHQTRVGLRRLRVALRELAGLAPAIDPAWDVQLSATQGRLGEQRDDVAVADALQPLLEAADAPVKRWLAAAPEDVGAIVRQPMLQATLVAVIGLAYADDEAFAPLSPAEARAFIKHRLQRLHRRVVRDGLRFESLDHASQHRVRKRLKRLRYLAEFVASLWPDKTVERYLDRLSPAQDALGEHHDAVVGVAKFRRDAVVEPAAWFAAGFLEARLVQTARRARKSIEPIDECTRFWKGQSR
ncbi:inorganic triphosphatase [soil metagenome]